MHDGISYEFIESPEGNKHVVGIHISDVAFWQQKLDLNEFITDRCGTVYTKFKTYPVYPRVLSSHILSLRENEDRLTISMMLTFDEQYNLVDIMIQPLTIKVYSNLSYNLVWFL